MRNSALAKVLGPIVVAGAFAAGLGYGNSTTAPFGAARPVQAAAPPPGPNAAAPLSFLQDNEPAAVQARQLAMLEQLPEEQRWRQYIAPYLAAQGVADAAVTQQDDDPPTPADLEAFRATYATFAVDIQRLLDLIPPDRRMDIKDRVAEAQVLIPEMTYDELAALKEGFADYPGFWSAPTWAANLLASSGHVQAMQLQPGGGAAQPQALPTLPPFVPQFPDCKEYGSTPICDDCPVAPAGGYISIAVLNAVAVAAKYGCQFIPPDLLTGSASIPNPVNVICVGVRVGLEIAAASLNLAYELANNCNEGVFYGLVVTYLDTTVSSRASQQSHDFHRAWNLRTDIEDNLLDLLDKRISTYQLPASQAGFLTATTTDLSVDWIVEDTINMQAAAGYDVRNAQAELADARILLSGGDYKNAFARYRKAYRAAVRVGRELPAATPTP